MLTFHYSPSLLTKTAKRGYQAPQKTVRPFLLKYTLLVFHYLIDDKLYIVYLWLFSDCPSLTLPSATETVTYKATPYCGGVHCCTGIDIGITQLFVDIWIAVDPCDFTLYIGFNNWTMDASKSDWEGRENIVTLADALHIE